MQTSRYANTGTMPLIRGNSYMTAHLLSRREWQERAVALAERERVIREAELHRGRSGLLNPMRWGVRASLGGALIRLGARLQGAGHVAELPARQAA
jgi:hypothetical protein